MGKSVLEELKPSFGLAGVLPVFEVAVGDQGYNFFFDHEIVRDRDRDLPLGMQGADRSSALAQWMGKALDYPPAKIDHLIYGWTAGMGRDYIRYGLDPVIRTLDPSLRRDGRPIERQDYPIIRTFLDREGHGRNETLERFYDDYDEILRAHRGYKAQVDEYGARSDEAVRFKEIHGHKIDKWTVWSRTQRDLSKLWKELRELYAADMDPDDLRAGIHDVETRIEDRARKPYQ
jgi:hypothetical protein